MDTASHSGANHRFGIAEPTPAADAFAIRGPAYRSFLEYIVRSFD